MSNFGDHPAGFFGSAREFYSGVATQSLRFDGSTSKLTRTPSTSGNQKKWTTSFWVKRTELGVAHYLWSGGSYSGNDGIAAIYFSSDDKIHTYFDTSGANPYGAVNNRVYRDTSAWYHIVWAVDAANTVQKIWVNGVEETLNSGNNPPNFDYGMNRAGTNQAFGVAAWGGSPDLDGYLAEITHLDNQYLDETYFGEFKDGVWIAKDTSDLTFGTNGFRLRLDQTGVGTASSSTIGADTSGNNNHFTSSGIVASDCAMPDSPENNFATSLGAGLAEPQDYQSYYQPTSSEGNLKVTGSSSGWSNGSSNFGMTSGKWYAECRIGAKAGTGYIRFGVRSRPARTYDEYFWNDDGTGQVDGTTSPYSARVGTYGAGDILMVALDLENNAIYFGKNGTWENSATSSEISAGTTTNAFVVSTTIVPTGDDNSGQAYFFYCQPHGTGSNITWNFGQDSSFAGAETAQGNSDSGGGTTDFFYTPPNGFLACNSVNLPELDIGPNSSTQADDYFNTVLYTSDNIGANGTQNVTGVGFKPDWVWLKNRTSGSTSHTLYDSNRGTGRHLSSDTNGAEVGLNSEYGYLGTFGDDGYTLRGGSTNANYVNQSTNAYVSWNWKANGGTTSSNTDGSITSTVQANTDAGFSIVTYSANNSAGATVGHGLGVAPDMVIVKKRNASERWFVWHTGDSTEYVYLNETFAGQANLDDRFGNNTTVTLPSSTVLTLGTNNDVNGASGTYVAYCFAEIEGYSKFGKYAGNGNVDGTFVYLGFRPAFLIYKKSSASGNWIMDDNKTQTFNPDSNYLVPNSADAEGDTTTNTAGHVFDMLSNGFKMRNTNSDRNANGATYIYMAFAEAPFKYANAR